MAEKWSKQVYSITKIAGKDYTIKSRSGDVLTKKGYELLKVPGETEDTFVGPTEAEKKQQKAADQRRVKRQLQREGLEQKGDEPVDTRLGRGAKRAAAPRRSGRLRQPTPKPAKATKPKKKAEEKEEVVTYSVSLFVHEFAKDILVMWTGFPLSAASREKKTVLKKDMGAANYKEEMDFLKQNKAGRKKMYEEWKGLQ